MTNDARALERKSNDHGAPTPEGVRVEAAAEGSLALRNGLKLGVSLLITWSVALVVTFELPRALGALPFGYYRYGFEFAALLTVFAGLGIDTYISREVPVRPSHASDFFGGVLLLRAALMVPLYAYGWFHLRDKAPEERIAAALFGLMHGILLTNQTLQQILQAASRVDGLAVANVAAKLLWVCGILASLAARAPLWVLPLPMLLSEALRAAFLYVAARRAVGLQLRLNLQSTKHVLSHALPFFVANAAVALGSSLDVVVLRELVEAGSREVGWYSAAREVSRLSALMSPVLSGVLVPMMSRAAHRNEDEFLRLLRRGLEAVCIVAIPVTLFVALSAKLLVTLALKAEFLPATPSLEWLAPTFLLAYVNVLLWIALMIQGRSWTLTLVSFLGLALLPVLMIAVVPMTRSLGQGGAAMGVAMALSAREFLVAAVFIVLLGRKAFDRRSLKAIGFSLGIGALVLAMHTSLAPLGELRLVADVLAYLVLAVVLRILRVDDLRNLVRLIRDRRLAH
jgi:O-antigen/teichoic acid export membrane protein